MGNTFHIVDDQSFINDIVSSVLEDAGYSTLSFSSPDEYLRHLSMPDYARPLAVITDIAMPGMNGYEMIESISERIPGIRFIVMSGDPSFPAAKRRTVCMYLAKPFTPAGLMEIVRQVMLCDSSEPSCDHGCGDVGDRDAFDLPDWQCPLERK